MPHHLDIKSTDKFTRTPAGAIYLYTPGSCHILRYLGGRLSHTNVMPTKCHNETTLTTGA